MKAIRVVGLVLLCLALLLASTSCGSGNESPPALEDVATCNVTETSATITWTTDKEARSQVEYGLGSDYGSTTTLDSALVTNHGVKLVGLAPATTYHFRAKSVDENGNIAYSEDRTLATSDLAIAVSHQGSNDGSVYWIWVTAVNQASMGVDLTVDIKLYNSSSVRIYVESQSIRDLDPGETWRLRCGYGNQYCPDIATYSVSLAGVSVSTMPEPMTSGAVVLLGQYPKTVGAHYAGNLDVVLRNDSQTTIQGVTLEVKYYWPDDGTLIYTHTWSAGPIAPGESVDPGVNCQMGLSGILYRVFIVSVS